MDRVLSSNPGLRSRFKTFHRFPITTESERLPHFRTGRPEENVLNRLDGPATEKVQAGSPEVKQKPGRGFRQRAATCGTCLRIGHEKSGEAALEHADSVDDL